MEPNNRKIYWILSLISLAGYAWIGFHLLGHDHTETTVCIFKNVTGWACPSCGITRSVLSLLHGRVGEALWINPLGVVALLLLVLIPVWLIRDVVRNQQSLLKVFRQAEDVIRTRKSIYIPLIILIVINWGWNIMKDL